MAVKPIPDGYHTVTPYLIVQGATQLIDFLKEAFEATELSRTTRPDGAIANAEVRIGDSIVETGDARDEWPPTPAAIHLYVNDTDATYRQALKAGARSLCEPEDMPYGERSAGVKDPAGNQWFISTRTEER
jgi:uncharacterized glyoxalase superfamily protein PhnB